MERQSKGSRDLEAYCKGGQGPPRTVAPLKKKCTKEYVLYRAFFIAELLAVGCCVLS